MNKFRVGDEVKVIKKKIWTTPVKKFVESKEVHIITSCKDLSCGYSYLLDNQSKWDFSEKELELVYRFEKGDDIEVSSMKDFQQIIEGKFYAYEPTLQKPYIIKCYSNNEDYIINMKYCRAVQLKYEPYTEFDPKWIKDGIHFINKHTYVEYFLKSVRWVDGWLLELQDGDGNMMYHTLQNLYLYYTRLDGTPFGKIIKE